MAQPVATLVGFIGVSQEWFRFKGTKKRAAFPGNPAIFNTLKDKDPWLSVPTSRWVWLLLKKIKNRLVDLIAHLRPS